MFHFKNKLIKTSTILFILCIPISSCTKLYTANPHPYFSLKEVLPRQEIVDPKNFSDGILLCPDCNFAAVGEDALIKRNPEITLFSRDILKIELKNQLGPKTNLPRYEVTFYLSDDVNKKMLEFSKSYINKYLAIEINGRIISIGKFITEIEHQFTFLISNKNINELKEIIGNLAGGLELNLDLEE